MTRRDAVPPFLSTKIALERRGALADAIDDAIRKAMSEGCGSEEITIVLAEIAERYRAHVTTDAGQIDIVGTVH
ncbi:hypothetical protein [Rhizobium tubonense]|uniref:Uncharacterized protein n=1 Tax=Rhizobium tubonense TaxID=484088 RepID=A0A2W4D1I7_9HYPH|nr:hypothetical protein [Rhizobium tubonense]PZM17261.1 hypothetical protein CPY51_03280 [Rhizobium tubonense]